MKKYLSMLFFVVILGTVATGILMGADYVTKDAIAKNAEFSWKSAVLTHHEIPHTTVDFSEVFDANFEVLDAVDAETETTLYLYKNIETNNVSFRFNGYGLWDVIEGVLTLADDFNTIINVTVTKQAETPGLGGIVAEEQYLKNYIGKKFDETLGIVAVKVPPTQDYEVDAITGATGTSNAFVGLLSANYRKYLRLFGDVNPDAAWMKAMLTHNNTEFTNDDFEAVFSSSFSSNVIGELRLFTHLVTGNKSYQFQTGGMNGPIGAVITLDPDFEVIVGLTVISQAEGWGAVIQTDPTVLEAFIGKSFDPNIVIVESPTNNNEVLDGFGGATTTKTSFATGLNSSYQAYYDAFVLGFDPSMVWKQALLTNNGVVSNETNYDALMNSTFTITTENDLTLYTNNSNSNVSFLFEATGLNGAIRGVVTLDDDFQTIVKISVYEQSETWGAVIQTNATFFDSYIGKKFSPNIVVVANPTAENEVVDGFGGATTTKNGLLTALNQTYSNFYTTFVTGVDPTMVWKQALLSNNGVESTELNFDELMTSTFTVTTDGDLTLYTNNTNQNVSYLFFADGLFGPIRGVITLDDDFQTIVKISVFEQSEKWGKTIQTDPTFFDAYVGKKFNPNIVVVSDPVLDNEILDGYGSATTTKLQLTTALNTIYVSYYDAFYVDPTKAYKQALLANNGVTSTDEDYNDLMTATFDVEVVGELTLYTNKTTLNVSYLFFADGLFGPIKGVVTLDDDFQTIVKISVFEQSEKWGKTIQTNAAFFDGYIGKKFNPNIVLVSEPVLENEVLDGYASATTTKLQVTTSLNSTYQAYYNAFKDGE